MIVSQYECVSNATSVGACGGGVEGLLGAAAGAIGKTPYIQICKYEYMYQTKSER